ncbi:16S rRNA (cytosine(1402)-N(4))-methyltransferase, partial [Bradyrhizobium diazoefficiens]
MAARQIPLGTLGWRPGTTGLGNHAGQGLGRGTAATRNHSRRYGLARPGSGLVVRQAWRMSSAPHIPVLGREAIDHLAPREGGIYVDATFGAGGYSRAILDVPGTRLIAIDRDRTAIAGGAELVERSAGRLTLVEDRFSHLADVC